MSIRADARKGGRGMHGRRVFLDGAGRLSMLVNSSAVEIAAQVGVFDSNGSKRASLVS